MLVRREDIKAGLKVIDPTNTPGIVYTWLAGGEFTQGALFYYTCDNCGNADQFVLREETEYPGYRCYSCIKCAGIDDLEPLVQIVK
jgi:hypothetical protein